MAKQSKQQAEIPNVKITKVKNTKNINTENTGEPLAVVEGTAQENKINSNKDSLNTVKEKKMPVKKEVNNGKKIDDENLTVIESEIKDNVAFKKTTGKGASKTNSQDGSEVSARDKGIPENTLEKELEKGKKTIKKEATTEPISLILDEKKGAKEKINIKEKEVSKAETKTVDKSASKLNAVSKDKPQVKEPVNAKNLTSEIEIGNMGEKSLAKEPHKEKHTVKDKTLSKDKINEIENVVEDVVFDNKGIIGSKIIETQEFEIPIVAAALSVPVVKAKVEKVPTVKKDPAAKKAVPEKKVISKELLKSLPIKPLPVATRPVATMPKPIEKKQIIIAHRRMETRLNQPKESPGTMLSYQPDTYRSILDAPEVIQTPNYRYSDDDLVEFRELITKRLESARKELSYLQGLITRKDEAGTEDTENRFMNMEDGSGAMEREQISQLASRQIQFINNLEKAMVRIENKTYGICRDTGKLIDKARLRMVPHATLSIEAKNSRSVKGK